MNPRPYTEDDLTVFQIVRQQRLEKQDRLDQMGVLLDWHGKNLLTILQEFGDGVYRRFWFSGIVALKSPGHYVLSFPDQLHILDLIDRVGLLKFLTVFVELGGDLLETVKVFEVAG